MNSAIKILLAEDDPNLGTVLRAYLNQKGYTTYLATNGQMATDLFKTEQIDFCILDIMMPIKDGFTVAEEVKTISPKVPIVFLSAKTQLEDKIRGFELGADDYITKPFSMEELMLRIQAILRRTINKDKTESTIFEIGKYTFDYNRQILTIKGKEQRITAKEADLLKLFCTNLNSLVDRNTALHKIWKNNNTRSARSMDVYITKLRKYLREDPDLEIVNIHGVGFKIALKS